MANGVKRAEYAHNIREKGEMNRENMRKRGKEKKENRGCLTASRFPRS
jgi:hypothetical protein